MANYLKELTSNQIALEKFKLIFSCEHGGYQIPAEWRHLFHGKKSVLKSHRGWDAGALKLARELASKLRAPLVFSDTSRLLIDLNRSLHHRNLFSEFIRPLDKKIKSRIIQEHYVPYRRDLERWISNRVNAGSPMLHFSIHSFVSRMNNQVRRADIGLLYDPSREKEREFCIKLQSLLNQNSPGLVVRRNYPYPGIADGFTTYLRTRFDGEHYCGIEIEINQKHVSGKGWREFRHGIVNSITVLCPQEES